MNDNVDLSFCELRCKEVINAMDGKRLGRIVDILFSCENGCVRGIVVPMQRRSIFAKNQEIYIPWKCVQKIGEDVILVALYGGDSRGYGGDDRRHPHERDDCRKDDTDCGTCDHHRPNCDEDRHEGNHSNQDGRGCDDDCEPCDRQKKSCRSEKRNDFPDCDRRCEKCMLFDCAYRWSGY